jgi:hypothetical protein
VEWVVDFPRIKAINTTVRFDGNYYSQRSVYSDMLPYYLNNRMSADGENLLPYIGWYYGGHNTNNGSESRSVKGNLTFTTNIPPGGHDHLPQARGQPVLLFPHAQRAGRRFGQKLLS